MRKTSHPDYVLLIIAGALVVVGILILASVSPIFSWEKFQNSYYFLFHQLGLGLLPGIILAFFAYRLDLQFLKKWASFLLLLNLVMMGLVFLPGIGVKFGGARRWLSLGPVWLQPAEFLKLTFIIYLAAWLSSKAKNLKTEKLKNLRTKKASKQLALSFVKRPILPETLFAFLVIVSIISLLLVLQPDISTLGIIIFVAGLLYFIAGTPLWQTFSILILGGAMLGLLIKIAPYRLARLLVFLNPGTDPMGTGYQIKQALIAVGSGGIFGLGLGMSQQKFGFLPFAMSDSIFAIFAEELGFVGTALLIVLFLLFLWQGFKIVKESSEPFCQLLAFGIISWITLQAFINMGAMVGFLPLTGVPLPFISYGGSALISQLTALGLLLNISKQRN